MAESKTSHTAGGWDFLRSALAEQLPEVPQDFIDEFVNKWNFSGSTSFNDPKAAERARARVADAWSSSSDEQKLAWRDGQKSTDAETEQTRSLWDTTGQAIVDRTAARGAEQREFYDQGSSQALGGLRDANDKATQQTADAIAALESSGSGTKEQINALIDGLVSKQASTDKRADKSLAGVRDAFGKFTSERDDATRQYLESLAPLQDKLQANGYEGVQTGAEDIGRLIDSFGTLKDTYGRYNELSSPEMTAKERAILEQGMQTVARRDKSARDAGIRDLAARGILSGGNLISNQAAAQQQLGDERVNAMLGAQGSAVDRALQGLAGMRSTGSEMVSGANQIRTGNDAMAQFNKSQQGVTERFQSEFAQQELERLQGLAQGKQDTILGKTSGDFTASSSLNRDTQDALDRAFGRSTQTTNTGLTGTQNKYAIDQGIAGEKTSAADREAGRASNLTGAELTNTNNRTNLIGSTGKDEDEALKYLLGLESEKANLRNLGVKI